MQNVHMFSDRPKWCIIPLPRVLEMKIRSYGVIPRRLAVSRSITILV
jgi:hypothetical protein